MPSSYQAPNRGSKESSETRSQSADTNTAKSDTTVAQVLSQKGNEIYSVRPQSTLADVVAMLKDKKIGALLVRDADGGLQGILSERDIVRKLSEHGKDGLSLTAEETMTKNVQTCHADDTLLDVLRAMTGGRFRHMPVMNGTDLAGLITIGDMVSHRLKELELEALQLKQLIVG